jgi:hypothetical protein
MSPLLSVLWALVPLFTVGWGVGFSFTYAAIRLRDWPLGSCAAGYFALGLTSYLLVSSSDGQSDWLGILGALLAIALIGLGSAHAFAIRRHLVEPGTQRKRGVKIVSQREQALV